MDLTLASRELVPKYADAPDLFWYVPKTSLENIESIVLLIVSERRVRPLARDLLNVLLNVFSLLSPLTLDFVNE